MKTIRKLAAPVLPFAGEFSPEQLPQAWQNLEEWEIACYPWSAPDGYRPKACARVGVHEGELHVLMYALEPAIQARETRVGGAVCVDSCLELFVQPLESDERFARHTFKHFHPTHYVINNLYRDQMTRNGHTEWMYDIVKQSVYDDTRLILNADDPMVARFGMNRDNVVWFGVERMPFSHENNDSVYNDGAYCPACKHPLSYDYYHYSHIGSYHCDHCGLHREKPAYAVTDASQEDQYIVINGESRIALSFNGVYHFYNTLAAFAACRELGIPAAQITDALQHYIMKNGRIMDFRVGEHEGTLLTSKHENSVSYDQSIRVAVRDQKAGTVIIIVDAISRKYFTSETSWLWDIDFELLGAPHIEKIILAGTYAYDLATRFSYTDISFDKIEVIENMDEAVQALRERAVGYIYGITCFSDKEKLLSRVEPVNPAKGGDEK